ncbi:MAG: hypothetical protein U0746_22250 [Gemmataceae bacterium]
MNVFCPSCGHRFDTVPPPHDPDGVVSCPKCLSTFATSGLAAPAPEPRRKLKKKPAKGFPVGPVVVLGLFAVAGAGAAIWFVTQRGAGPTNPSPSSKLATTGKSGTGPTATAPAEWKEFASDEGKFKVLVPASLSRTKLKNGAIEYKLDTGELLLGVVTADLTGPTLGKKSREDIINAERDNIIKGGGKLVRESSVTSGDHKGTEVVIEMPGKGTTYYRYFPINRRVYKLEIGGKTAPPHEKDVAKFFESFQVTG